MVQMLGKPAAGAGQMPPDIAAYHIQARGYRSYKGDLDVPDEPEPEIEVAPREPIVPHSDAQKKAALADALGLEVNDEIVKGLEIDDGIQWRGKEDDAPDPVAVIEGREPAPPPVPESPDDERARKDARNARDRARRRRAFEAKVRSGEWRKSGPTPRG